MCHSMKPKLALGLELKKKRVIKGRLKYPFLW